ncbi:MAG: UDP-2,3-diacylglucosamine diphosphatase [candidate division WOR-3 bacterium]
MSARYFISDAHIGAGFSGAEQRLNRFLEAIQGRADGLYILGDLFEFWFEYQRVVPRHGLRILGRLADLHQSGTKVVFLRGNHDYWLGYFLKREFGMIVAGDELAETVDGHRVYLTHGDGIDRGVVARLFRRLVRSRLNSSLYSLLHPDIGIGLARWVAGRSRELGAKLYLQEAMARFAERKIIKEGFEIVIMGHSHLPEERIFGNGRYLNIGDWVKNFTYGLIQDGRVSLERFR